MEAAVSEAASELSKLGLAELLQNDPTRCKFLFGPHDEVIIHYTLKHRHTNKIFIRSMQF